MCPTQPPNQFTRRAGRRAREIPPCGGSSRAWRGVAIIRKYAACAFSGGGLMKIYALWGSSWKKKGWVAALPTLVGQWSYHLH